MNRIEKLTQFLRDSPNDSFLKHALALEYVKAGKDEEAATLFGEILAREPGYIGSYYHLGKALERLGRLSEAIKIYEEGMQKSRETNDNHAFNELKFAHEDASDI